MTEREGNVSNPFLNLIGLWQNNLMYWIEVNRDFYENAIWDPSFKTGNPSQRETVKVE
jgi:hypothetical protein